MAKFFVSLFLASALAISSVLAQTPAPSPTPAASPAQKPAKADKDKKKKDEKADKEKKPDEPAKDSADEFQIPVPIGDPVKGVRIPHYDDKGKLVMVFNAEVARKTDEKHLSMDNLKIDGTGDDGKKFFVEMPESVFDLDTRVLTGDQRVLIRREDFEITGQKGEFYIKTRFAKVIGDVKMVIFSTEDLTK